MNHKLHLVVVLIVLALLSVACRPAQPAEPTAPPPELAAPPTQEPEQPEPAEPDEPAWTPELLWRAEITDVDGDVTTVHSVAFSPDGQWVAAGVYLEARLYDARDGSLARTIEARHSVEDLAFSPDGGIVGLGQTMYGVLLSDVQDGSELHNLRGGSSYNTRLSFHPDGEVVATSDRSGAVYLWRVADGEQLDTLEVEETDFAVAMGHSSDGSLIAIAHMNNQIYLWHVDERAVRYALETRYSVEDVAISPTGNVLAVASNHDVLLFDLADGSPLEQQVGHERVRALDFSSDGRWLASAGNDGRVRVWDTADWSRVFVLEHLNVGGTSAWFTDVAISHDGSRLAAGTWDGFVYLWQLVP